MNSMKREDFLIECRKAAFDYIGESGFSIISTEEAFGDLYDRIMASFIDGACDWMMSFQNGEGAYPLYDFAGNLRKAMEDIYRERL